MNFPPWRLSKFPFLKCIFPSFVIFYFQFQFGFFQSCFPYIGLPALTPSILGDAFSFNRMSYWKFLKALLKNLQDCFTAGAWIFWRLYKTCTARFPVICQVWRMPGFCYRNPCVSRMLRFKCTIAVHAFSGMDAASSFLNADCKQGQHQ